MLKEILWGIIGIVGCGIFVLVVSPKGEIVGLNIGVFFAMLVTWVLIALYVLLMRAMRRR
jgi:mannitol-specific phosphotransferase system IIBC component